MKQVAPSLGRLSAMRDLDMSCSSLGEGRNVSERSQCVEVPLKSISDLSALQRLSMPPVGVNNLGTQALSEYLQQRHSAHVTAVENVCLGTQVDQVRPLLHLDIGSHIYYLDEFISMTSTVS